MLKRNNGGEMDGISTMEAFIGQDMDEKQTQRGANYLPQSLPDGVKKLLLKQERELGI